LTALLAEFFNYHVAFYFGAVMMIFALVVTARTVPAETRRRDDHTF
jgi:predicted MFS family arabinose efflux permease